MSKFGITCLVCAAILQVASWLKLWIAGPVFCIGFVLSFNREEIKHFIKSIRP